MKTLFLLLVLPLASAAQYHFGLAPANHHSVHMQHGWLIKKHWDIQAGVYPAYRHTDVNPTVSYAGIGYKIKTITGTVGASYHDFGENTHVPGHSGWRMYYSVEHNIMLPKGALFTTAALTNGKAYMSFGIKTWLTRKKFSL